MPDPTIIPKPRVWTRLPGVADTSAWRTIEDFRQSSVQTDFRSSEAYRITLSDRRKSIEVASDKALRYAWQHLEQWRGGHPQHTPCGVLEDAPEFKVRGFMLDISRCKVPTRESLTRWVDWLTAFRYNQLQLYTEHTFAYSQHKTVWQDASPITPEDLKWLHGLCQERGIELVPNQNCFGHFERWIKHPSYRQFAEAPDGFTTPWGTRRDVGSVLQPDDASFDLVSGLLNELLPHFSSNQVNIGCDETFELGQGASKNRCAREGTGKVYTDFLIRVMHHAMKKHQKRPQFWGDILLSHPDQLPRIPKDALALEWGYEADHPFEQDAQRFAEAGLEFIVCPGTSSWRSFSGRTQNMLENIQRAALQAQSHGAQGLLLTDWGDCGHLQLEEVSAPALAWCGLQAWNPQNASFELATMWCDQAVFASPGDTGAWLATGEISDHLNWNPGNSNAIFQCFLYPENHHDRIAQLETAGIQQALEAIGGLKSPHRNPEAWDQTLRNLRLGLLRELDRRTGSRQALPLQQEAQVAHEALWLQRNRKGGLAESLSMYTSTEI
jgi:hypothetical protein